MATEFDVQDDTSVEDFKTERLDSLRPMSMDEINRAAITVMAESDPVNSFMKVSRERSIENTSVTQQQISQNQFSQAQQAAIGESFRLLANEEIPLEERKLQFNSLVNGDSPVFEQRNIAAARLSSSPSEGESFDKEEQTISWAANIAEWNEFVDYKQKALASYAAQLGHEDAVRDWADIAFFLLPFADAALRDQAAAELVERGIIDESQRSAWGSPKTNQEAIVSAMSAGDLATRKKMVQEIINAIDTSQKGFLNYESDFAKVELARAALEDGYWGDFEGYLGNTTHVLDLVSIVLPFMKRGRLFKAGDADVQGILDEVRGDYIKNGASPNSPAEMARHTNVDQARKLHTALDSSDEDFAKAAYGTDKNSAIVDDVLPDPHSPSGAVRQKVANVDSLVDKIEEIQLQSGRTIFTAEEKQAAREAFIGKLASKSKDDISIRTNQSQFGASDDAGRFKISAVYGASDEAGFLTPQAALDQVLYANRELGIAKENLTVLKRGKDGRYVETTFDDVSGNDYLVRMDTVHELNIRDLRSVMPEDASLVRSSVLDMIPGFQGKATGYVKVMESTFSPKISLPVLAEAERGTKIRDVMGESINSFVNQMKSLDQGMQVRVDEYLRKANLEGIKFSPKDLADKGFTKAEIKAISTFRQFYDDMYVLDNKLAIKEFTDEGFGIIDNVTDNSFFIAKPISRVEAGATGRVYVMKTGETMSLQDAAKLGSEFDDLQMYKLPGEMRTPTHSFEYILSEDRFWRGMRGSDEVKPYRDGYYTVDYVEPLFIRKKFTDAEGRVRTTAVATASDVQSAKREAARLNSSNSQEGVEYIVDLDIRDVRNAKRQVDMEHGNYNMKFRGERLMASDGVSDEVLRAPIKDPLSAMISSADKLSKRLSMDDVYRGMKARFVAAYKDVLPQGQYPDLVEHIASSAPGKQRLVDQAKVMYNWMEGLRRPDPILVDEGFKKSMSRLANYMGDAGWTKTEKVARAASQLAPVASVKKAVFDVFVALNPPRQITLAVADSLKTAAISPKYLASGKIFRDSTAMHMIKMGVKPSTAAKLAGRSEDEIMAMVREFDQSGLSSGIQQQARVQKGVSTATEEISLQEAMKGKGKITKAKEFSEKIGFQSAERLQNLAAWLAFRDAKSTSAKRFKLTRAELDEITGKARHFTYSQTKEAAPSYNTSVAATVMQFAGVIHKGISLTLPEVLGGSRVLSGSEKAKLWTFLLSTYGVSLTKGIDEQLIKVEDKDTRETLRGGLLWLLVNKTTGASISTKNLNPADYAGFAERIYSIANGDWARATPALGLVDKLQFNAQVASSLWGDVGSDVLEMETVDKLGVQAKALAEFFPLASNYMKGQVYREMKRSVSKHNYTKDAELTSAEIFFKTFGFQTKEEEDRFLIRSMHRATLEEKKADVKSLIEGIRSVASLQGISNEEMAKRLSTSQVFWMAYKNDPDIVDMVDKELQYMLTNDDTVYQAITKMVGIMDAEDMKGVINIAPLSDEERQQAFELVDDVVNLKGDIE